MDLLLNFFKLIKNIEFYNIKLYFYGFLLISFFTIINMTKNELINNISVLIVITLTYLLLKEEKENNLKIKIFFGFISLTFFSFSYALGFILILPEDVQKLFFKKEFIEIYIKVISITLTINLITVIIVFFRKDLIIFNRILNVVLISILSLIMIKFYNYKELSDFFTGLFNSLGIELKNKDNIYNLITFHSNKIIEILNNILISSFLAIAFVSSICIFVKFTPKKCNDFFKLTNVIIYFIFVSEILQLYYSNFEMIYLNKFNIDVLVFTIRESYLFILLIILFNNLIIDDFLKYNTRNIIIKSLLIFIMILLLIFIINKTLNIETYIKYIILVIYLLSFISLIDKNKVTLFSLFGLIILNISMILFMIFKNVNYNYIEPLIFYLIILIPLFTPRLYNYLKKNNQRA